MLIWRAARARWWGGETSRRSAAARALAAARCVRMSIKKTRSRTHSFICQTSLRHAASSSFLIYRRRAFVPRAAN